jgi:hypothetical protein
MIISRKLIVEQPNYDLEFLSEQTNRDNEKRIYIRGQYIMMNRGNKNRRKYLEEEMIPAVDTYIKEYVQQNRGGGELNHCVPSNYKILTSKGWKFLSDIADDEIVATLNTETEEIEYSKIKEKIYNSYSGKMIRIKGRNINMLCTPNHRILIKNRQNKYEYLTAIELLENKDKSNISHSYIPKTGQWNVTSPEKFTLKGIKNVKKLGNYNNDITKDIEIDYNVFVSFLGLYLAEGHFQKGGRHYGVHISQIKDTYLKDIENLLNKFPIELSWKKTKTGFCCNDRRLNEYVAQLGDCYNKFIPSDIKEYSSAEDLSDLIYWFNIGDGRFNLIAEKYSTRNVFTVCNTLIDDLNECLFKSGLSGNISIIAQKDSIIKGRKILKENTKPLFLLNLSKTQGVYLDSRFIEITEESYDGDIGCVRTDNSNWYCMDDSGKTYWSGNSSSPDVDLGKLADKIVHLERDKNDPDFYIGKSLILSTPSGKILESLVHDGVKFGKSTKCLGQISESTDGFNIVQSPIVLLVDNVFDPSVSTAFVNGILENKEYIISNDGRVAEAYHNLEKKLAKYPSKHRDAINEYIKESLEKFLKAL